MDGFACACRLPSSFTSFVYRISFYNERNHKTIDSQRNGAGTPCPRQNNCICVSVPLKYPQRRSFHHPTKQNIQICHFFVLGKFSLSFLFSTCPNCSVFACSSCLPDFSILLLLAVDDLQQVHSSPEVLWPYGHSTLSEILPGPCRALHVLSSLFPFMTVQIGHLPLP